MSKRINSIASEKMRELGTQNENVGVKDSNSVYFLNLNKPKGRLILRPIKIPLSLEGQ